MATVPLTIERRRIKVTPFQILSYVVLGFAALAVVVAFIDGPTTFMQVLVIGLSNGALYALIALGYTMVYGIIELINFAHGDLVMIGSVAAAIILEERLGQTTSSPNGDIGADAMVSVIAHELEEAVTDPNLNAWYDNRGNENADKCAWTFGTTSGPTGAKYNMTLGSRNYLIQRNWVNAAGGYCDVKYP